MEVRLEDSPEYEETGVKEPIEVHQFILGFGPVKLYYI